MEAAAESGQSEQGVAAVTRRIATLLGCLVLVFATAAWGQDTPPDGAKPPGPPAEEEKPAPTPPADEEKPAPAPVILPSASFDAWIPLKPDKVSEQLKLVQAELEAGNRISRLTKPLLALFTGQAGARVWRRSLTEGAHAADAGMKTITDALEDVRAAQQNAARRHNTAV